MPDPSSGAWTPDQLADPHHRDDKPEKVRAMFAAISRSYDLNNRLHSGWRDQAWRRRVVKWAAIQPTDRVLDVACGTGDLTQAFAAAKPTPREVVGLDFTQEMLDIAAQKQRRSEAYRSIRYLRGDAQALPFEDARFDVLSIAFGIRNVADPAKAIREFRRVLAPNGRLLILEFSTPRSRVVRWGSDLFTRRIMPRTATWLSGDRSGAYRYLPASVATFMEVPQMCRLLEESGFVQVKTRPMTLGICTAYRAVPT